MPQAMTLGNSHFLSATNPLATADQRDLEALGLRIWQTPQIRKATQNAAARMKILVGRAVPAEAWESFDSVMDEWAFRYALMAANSDPNYPKVLGCHVGPAHEWFGLQVPGNRGFGGDNPDNNYTIVAIDARAHFEISGRRFDPAPVDVQFSLMANYVLTLTLANLDWRDMEVSSDGTFIMTLGPEPAEGRPNHIQTGPDARFLLIREVRGDWRQIPMALRIRRLDPPTAPPLTFQQMVDRAARFSSEDVAAGYLFNAKVGNQDANTVEQPFGTGEIGGLITQMMTGARLELADDEAFVVTVGPGGAKYHVLPLYCFWHRTMDFWQRTGSMNNQQSIPNADGTYTYVISIQDPAVHNWIDTCGLHEPRFLLRWHVLPRFPVPGGGPWLKGELVKLDDLARMLPAGMQRVTPDERKKQLAERLETFNLRHLV